MESISPLDLNDRGDRGSFEYTQGNDLRPKSLLDCMLSDSVVVGELVERWSQLTMGIKLGIECFFEDILMVFGTGKCIEAILIERRCSD